MAIKEIYLSKRTEQFTTLVHDTSLNYRYLLDIHVSYSEAMMKYREYIKDNKVEKAQEIVDSVLENYDKLFRSPKISDKDPHKGNDTYKCLAEKFLYYSIFVPANSREKPPRDAYDDAPLVHKSLLSYTEYYKYTKLQKFSDVEKVYEYENYFNDLRSLYNNFYEEPGIITIGPLITQLADAIKEDFNKAKKEVEKEVREEDSLGYITLERFDVDNIIFKKYFYTIKEKNFYESLQEKWIAILEEYKNAVINNTSTQEKNTIKNKALVGLDSIYEASETRDRSKIIFYRYHPLWFDNAILFKFCVFLIYNYDSLTTEKNRSLGPDDTGELIDYYIYEPINDNGKTSDGLTLNDLIVKFNDKAKKIFKDIDEAFGKIAKDKEDFRKTEARMGKYNEKEANILKNSFSEEEFFFVKDLNNKKHIPISPYVEIDIKTYPENMFYGSSTTIPEWVSVTKRIEEISYNNEIGESFYSDNYFESFSMNDLGNEKEIKLTLKSSSETNLEDLLFNSITGPIKLHKQNKTEGIEELIEIIKNKDVNFRLRFGYSDITNTEETINNSDINSIEFSNRTLLENMGKPVIKSPWLYFIITKFNVNTIENESTFEIEGVTLGNYILNNFVLYKVGGDNTSFSFSHENGTVEKVLGEIAKSLYEASGHTICILGGDEENPSVITGNNINNINDYSYRRFTLNNEVKNFAASDLNFDIFTSEASTSPSANQNVTSREFSLITEKESKEKKLPSIKEALDRLTDWLPTKMFALIEEGESRFAAPVSKTDDNIDFIRNDFTIKEIKPYYEILEVDAKLDGEIDYSRKTFIRFFYKGPMANEDVEGIRKYTFRGKQNSIVKSVSIENNVDFGKIKGTAGIIGSGFRSIYSADISVLEENSGSLGNIVNSYLSGEDTEGSTVIIAKDGIVYYDSSIAEDIPEITKEERKRNVDRLASVFLFSMENHGYKGEIEILGDPFFLSDRSLQLGKYMIYLEINRNKNNAYEGGYKRSYYTGLYYITGIEHSMNSSGDFYTKLKIAKFFAE